MISEEISRAVYEGDGQSKEFVIPFNFDKNEDASIFGKSYQLNIWLIGEETQTLLKEDIDYEIKGIVDGEIKHIDNNPTLALFNAPQVGEKVAILRDVPLTQLVKGNKKEPLNSVIAEDALDKLTEALQEIKEKQSRSIAYGVGSSQTTDAQAYIDEMSAIKDEATAEADRAKSEADSAKEQADIATTKATEAEAHSVDANNAKEQASISAGLAKLEADRATEEANKALLYSVDAKEDADRASDYVAQVGNIGTEKVEEATAKAIESANNAAEAERKAIAAAESAEQASNSLATIRELAEQTEGYRDESETSASAAASSAERCEEIFQKLGTAIKIKGRVDKIEDLPMVGNLDGDAYLVGADGLTSYPEYYWYQNHWEYLGTSGGGGTWGTITGDIASQTDLQNLFDAKQDVGDYATRAELPKIAKANTLGLVAGGNWLTVNQTTGKMECGELTKAQYNSALGYTFISKTTLENRLVDKQDNISDLSTIRANAELVSTKQDTLVSGTNIKTINNESILGEGNIEIKGGADNAFTPDNLKGGKGIEIVKSGTSQKIAYNFGKLTNFVQIPINTTTDGLELSFSFETGDTIDSYSTFQYIFGKENVLDLSIRQGKIAVDIGDGYNWISTVNYGTTLIETKKKYYTKYIFTSSNLQVKLSQNGTDYTTEVSIPTSNYSWNTMLNFGTIAIDNFDLIAFEGKIWISDLIISKNGNVLYNGATDEYTLVGNPSIDIIGGTGEYVINAIGSGFDFEGTLAEYEEAQPTLAEDAKCFITDDVGNIPTVITQEQLNDKADRDLSNCTRPYVVEQYDDGNGNGYRVWSNKCCEQWGTGTSPRIAFSFIREWKDTNYRIVAMPYQRFDLVLVIKEKQTTTCTIDYSSSGSGSFEWFAIGYIL